MRSAATRRPSRSPNLCPSNAFLRRNQIGRRRTLSLAIERALDALYERQQRSTDLKSRLELERAFEARALTQAASVPLLREGMANVRQ